MTLDTGMEALDTGMEAQIMAQLAKFCDKDSDHDAGWEETWEDEDDGVLALDTGMEAQIRSQLAQFSSDDDGDETGWGDAWDEDDEGWEEIMIDEDDADEIIILQEDGTSEIDDVAGAALAYEMEVHPVAPEHARPLEVTDETYFIARGLREEAYLGEGSELAPCTPGAAAKVVAARGVARVPRVLSEATATRLHAHVLGRFELLSNAESADGASDDDSGSDAEYQLVAVGSGTQRLSKLAADDDDDEDDDGGGGGGAADDGSSGDDERRWDVRLSPEEPLVRQALRELLSSPLGAALEKLAGRDAVLWELATIMSAPGCPPQIVHADATWSPSPLLLTSFVALQPVERAMGPTRFLPGTHAEPSPAATVAAADATHLRSGGGAGGDGDCGGGVPPASCVALLDTGDAALYDGRTLHCGGANRSDRRRLLLYLTFRRTDEGEDGESSSRRVEDGESGGGQTLGSLLDELSSAHI